MTTATTTAQPGQGEPLLDLLTPREKQVKGGFTLSEWANYSIIERVKESSELPFTDASNLILAGQRHSNYTTVSYPLPPTNGGFIMSDSLKHCSKCDQYLDLSLFGKNKSAKDGLTHWCKSCKKISSDNYRAANKEKIVEKSKVYRETTGHDSIYYAANREKILAQKREYSEKNKEILKEKHRNYYYANQEQILDRAKVYQQKNKPKLNLKSRKYHWANRERILPLKREYYSAHLDHASVKRSRYRATKFGCEGSHTVEEWKYIKEINGNKCLKCGRTEPEIKLSVDHIIPLSRGGTDNIGNIQPLCLSCNKRKFTKIEDYRSRRLVRGKLRTSR